MSSLSRLGQFKDVLKKEQKYIDAIIKNLENNHPNYADAIKKRMQVETEHLGLWYELMVYDWLWKQRKNPFPQPNAPDGKSKPDFVFPSNDKKIYIDVASVQESEKDKEFYERQDFWSSESTASFATMRERLLDKAGRHKSIANTGDAYVICLGLESPLINIEDVKTCFIGNDSYNVSLGKLQSAINGEIFERENSASFLVKYKNVSAILVGKRNYSLNEDENKLEFGLIQNPYAITEIQPVEFSNILRFVVIVKKEKYFQMGWQH